MRRRREEPRQHPEPSREAELQRIRDLRRIVSRKQQLLDDTADQIRRLNYEIRTDTSPKRVELYRSEAADLRDKVVPRIESEVMDLHEQIRTEIGKIDPEDLAFL